MQGGGASSSKQQRTSYLAGKSSGRRKLDRLNYLFEAIEADKASDSETTHGTDSRGSHAGKSESPRALCAHGTETLPGGVLYLDCFCLDLCQKPASALLMTPTQEQLNVQQTVFVLP